MEIIGTIIEEKIATMGTDELVRGVYRIKDGGFLWVSFSASGTSRKIETAKKKAGI